MKRIITILILLIICGTLYATTLLDSRLFTINTHIDHDCLITLTAAEATLSSGMPFDITETNAAYNSSNLANGTGGWMIATWSIEANMPSFTLSFDAQPLTSATNETKLGYYLIFKYVNSSNEDQYFTIHTSSSGDVTTSPVPPSSGPLVSLNNNVMFMFDSSVNTASAPAGAYYGSLTITLTEGT
ncbi:MAG: hypothetical protein K6E89_07500 [Sphaerochaetaceae bacterium]|nr:hypothetical protein [Sphaerochaetaceae bacterium]